MTSPTPFQFLDQRHQLIGDLQFEEISLPSKLLLEKGKTVLFEVQGRSKAQTGRKRFDIAYTVENLKITPDAGLPVLISFDVEFVPAGPSGSE